ncbi:linear amide C-N hydrolase [Vibrio sp. SCSIO 43135]|uniref:Linear amide C-N hydrolase n=1 Tax=Vibrio paucivorans TaxID=2829489 RepID=A0A9X3CGR0_9VIBR|nr:MULTISPECIES: linear amide C-N hydrolase [Vibrio]MCW8335554.1 linear amide C-N hydrolase [Vibrio paucivorans]USD43628.1 linear amide C-N hydrolase [Vibrio sp. SCSIO 43135]
MKFRFATIALLVGLSSASIANACTSVAWNTEKGTFTSRTNDWVEATNPTLGGIQQGDMRSLQGNGVGDFYQVKYDIVAVLAYGELVHDGVNSEGLQVNTLFYNPMHMPTASNPSAITQFVFGEYLLANYATVDEAVKAIPTLNVGSLALEGMPMEIKLHWSITDKSGDRAVIEFDEDGINIYRGEEAMVMTNDPSMQVHIENQKNHQPNWENADRETDIGSNGNANAKSRFLHASYFQSKLTEPTSIQNGLMKLASVPYRVPTDAPYKDFGFGMSGYATEWTLTQSLETGDSVFEYNFKENWNTVKFNVYELMGKEFRVALATSQISQLAI